MSEPHPDHPVRQWEWKECCPRSHQLKCSCHAQYDDTSEMWQHYAKKHLDKANPAQWMNDEWECQNDEYRCRRCGHRADTLYRIWNHSSLHLPRYLQYESDEIR